MITLWSVARDLQRLLLSYHIELNYAVSGIASEVDEVYRVVAIAGGH